MKAFAYYNEFDPQAAEWLRSLIKRGLVMDGEVDERSITDVQPSDLQGFVRCHFFAGIAGWDLALQLTGWPEDRPVWTGSCPCQPFSAAGKGKGVADERHLWPAFFSLIEECHPPEVFGEQVASHLGLEWLAGVFADLEGTGYAAAGADLPAACVGAPSSRQRFFWAAKRTYTAINSDDLGWVCLQCGVPVFNGCECDHGEMQCEDCGEWTYPFYYELPHDGCHYCGSRRLEHPGRERGKAGVPESSKRKEGESGVPDHASDPLRLWDTSSILVGKDGKARRIEPSIFPLAHGVPGRVGLLRGYGNAIVPQVAAAFIQAYIETLTP